MDWQSRISFVRDDIVAYMKSANGNDEFDVIVLDPPKLAPSLSTLDKDPESTRFEPGCNEPNQQE